MPGRASARKEGGGATGGGRSPPPTGEGGKGQGSEQGGKRNQPRTRGTLGDEGGFANSTPVILYGGEVRAGAIMNVTNVNAKRLHL